MGISPSKRVHKTLRTSPEFTSACSATYTHFLSLTQHAFSGLKPYQLLSATQHLHLTLSQTVRLVSKWAPNPPDRAQVDRALKTVLSRRPVREEEEENIALDEAEFTEFAVEVFADAVVLGARGELVRLLQVGVAGIVGVGSAVTGRKDVVAVASGAYALGVALGIYDSLND